MSGMAAKAILAAVAVVCSITAMTQESPWLDVPFVTQPDNGCGAAAISMTLQYWARHGTSIAPGTADVAAIQNKLYSVSDHGIKASALTQYFADNGFSAFAFHGSFKDFEEHLSKGRPLIIALQESKSSRLLHYVVVVGIIPREDLVLVNDPARRKLLKMETKEFQQAWAGAENWTLLVVPKS